MPGGKGIAYFVGENYDVVFKTDFANCLELGFGEYFSNRIMTVCISCNTA
jgi:hypothetical protein